MNTIVGFNQTEQVGQNKTTTVKKSTTINTGEDLVLEAGNSITLKAGEASITLKKNGEIVISGNKININGDKNVTLTGKVVDVNP